MFFYAYRTLLYHIDECKEKDTRAPYRYKGCSEFKDVKELMMEETKENFVLVPMITPKGLYGINSFLYCYFNGLFPIGITTNPIAVHGIEVGDSSFSYIEHDLDHYEIVSNKSENYQMTEYPIYRYILQNQEEIGVERCKGLLFIMFFQIHENLDPGLNETIRLLNRYWYDWWDFIASNGYYTPEYFNIIFPKELFRRHIDITRHDSEGFRTAMNNDKTFYENVFKFLEAFATATYNDYMKLRKALL